MSISINLIPSFNNCFSSNFILFYIILYILYYYIILYIYIQLKKQKIKYVGYSSQESHTVQLDSLQVTTRWQHD